MFTDFLKAHKEVLERGYAVPDGAPITPYVLVGQLYIGERLFTGVWFFTDNEFHAHLIKKKFRKYGSLRIERTIVHPDGPTIIIESYKKFEEAFKS